MRAQVAPVLYDTKSDPGRIILEALRASMRPLTTPQERVQGCWHGLDTTGQGPCAGSWRRTNANLKHWAKKRGLIRSMPGPGQQLLWEVVR